MSKIIVIENIDGFEIVKGISKLQIDPIASKEVIYNELMKTPEFIACAEKQNEVNSKFVQAGAKRKQAHVAATQRNKTLSEALYTEFKQLYDQAMELMKEVRNLLPAVKAAKKELYKTHAVYFNPGKNEKIKTESEIESIKTIAKNLPKDKSITSDGTLIDNYSGMSFYHKENGVWIETFINKVGVNKPDGSVLFDVLSGAEQVEALHDINVKRISLLSTSEKESEKQVKLKDALTNARIKRSEFEIQNDPEALTKSQAWYEDQVAEINDLYQ
jgi:hypothetical protein